MTHADYGYGLWGLALVNAAVFILFAFSFFKPQTLRDWRSFSAFSAFGRLRRMTPTPPSVSTRMFS